MGLRIAIFTESYYPNFDGVVQTIIKTTNALAVHGHRFCIFTSTPAKESRETPLENHPNIEVIRFFSIATPGYKTLRLSFPNFVKANKKFREFEPQLVHIESPGPMGFLGLILGKYHRIRIIMTYHTYLPDFLVCLSPAAVLHLNSLLDKTSYRDIQIRVDTFLVKQEIGETNLLEIKNELLKSRPQPLKKIVQTLLIKFHNQADLVTTPSLAMEKQLKSEGLTVPVKFLSNGIQCKVFFPKTGYVYKKRLLHVGRLSYEKKIDVLLEALALALQTDREFSLSLYGTGPATEHLQTLVRNNNLQANVTFHGFVDNNLLPEIYRSHDLFLTASTIETQGLVVLEAMACGLPVIGVNKLALPDLIRHGKNGYLAEAGDSAAIAEFILNLNRQPELLESFGRQSVTIAKEHDFPVVIQQLEELYKEYAGEYVAGR